MHITGAERALALLGYLGPFFFIPVIARKDSMFVQFHGRQGGVLFMLLAIWAILFIIILVFVDPGTILAPIFIFLFYLGVALYVFFALVAMIKVLLGERYRMPVVADVALKMGL